MSQAETPAPPDTSARGEREVFRYTTADGRCIRLVAAGPMDDGACEALDAFVSLRRRELERQEDSNAR